ncbi:MAG: rRNA maturation RNase YbeY [Clostridia bacterium]|nr:rRNA maturation RNase YbeY [Clostridia bacterium]
MQIYFCQYEQDQQFEADIKKMYKIALETVGVKYNIAVNIIDVSPETINEMNRDYRGVDMVTDVLSFPMLEDIKQLEDEPDFMLGECNIGDIYINPIRAKEQAKEYGHSLRREYCFLALHGLLHLLGYDHIKKKDEVIMFKLQDEILQKANIGRD